MNKPLAKRRTFLQTAAAGTAGLGLAGPMILTTAASETKEKLAMLGGTPICKAKSASWPKVVKEDGDEDAWMDVLNKKGWCRLDGEYVNTFEKEYAKFTGVKECLATSCGTTALYTSLNALGIGPGDEVLVTPYTFVATINVILLQYALPIFVDTDRETFLIDPKKLEEKITEKTRAILPVHIGGNVCNMDAIMEVAKKHKLIVVEDACQAHLAEWRGKKVGSIGNSGCFSFQVTKNLCSGEGGAVITDDSDLMDRCFSFHSNGRERTNKYGFGYVHNGINARMTEFSAALLLQGMKRVEEQSRLRTENALYLSKQLEEIPGIHPAKMYEGTTRNAYHLYMFRYDAKEFGGVPRDKFLNAMSAEGAGCGSGYSPLNKEPFLKDALYSRGYQAVYSKERIDKYFSENECPENDRLCKEEACWWYQTQFLATKEDMDQRAAAVRKIHAHAAELAKA
ncbi:MAG: aminotransferase class I/II-fold pyridoxal phosphate-dependent enzyme [Candidatus Omnitrophota bacterium]